MKLTFDQEAITVVTACDDNFVIMAAAFLKSLEANSKCPQQYVTYILADNISVRNKKRLQNATNLQVHIIDLTRNLLEEFPLPSKVDYLPKSAYYRLLIPELFTDFPKVIYLDVDLLVLTDLARLWNLDMEGNFCLACQCFYADNHRGQQNFRKLGIDENAPYFNSGVLVMDLVKWRQYKVRERVNQLLNHELNDPKAMDEEALNVILHGKWKPIDQRWNYPPHIVDENKLPHIIHYIGFKPMYYDYKTGAQELFFHYLKGTYWETKRAYGFLKKVRIKAPFVLKLYLNKVLRHSPFYR